MDLVYWVALAHLPRWNTERINSLIIQILQDKKLSLPDFFELNEPEWQSQFNLNEKEISDLKNTKTELPNLSFQVEKLINQGFEIIPINSPDYSKILKENLKVKYAPSILYIKGNKQLLKENCVAIVGSRDAGERALKFTDNIAKKMSKEYKVVASGFARGVDKQALDSAIENNGQSIIVLPQGILTFQSGMKKYYKQINEGNVLVLSTYPPEAGWSTGLAMGRNRYIYGLAKEIYVAETSSSGGTWSGAIDGLKKGRDVYVLMPEKDDKNSNLKLINEGCIPVDIAGNKIDFQVQGKTEQMRLF